jgi:hypothetical protein
MNETITHVDDIQLDDQNRVKVELVHEKMYRELDINPVEVLKKTGLLKTIPRDWIIDIIKNNIKSISITRNYENFNNSGEIVLSFNSINERIEFFKQFNSNLYNELNSFIENKDSDPKQFNRILTIESADNGLQLSLRF